MAAIGRHTEDLLPCVSTNSLCLFKCVTKHWLGLVDHPDHRRK
jgi:hypothetical protein